MTGFGVIALMSAGTRFETLTRAWRSVLFIGTHFLLLTAIAWVYPGLLDGPLPMLKGLAKTYWFDRINFEQGMLSLFSYGDMRSVLQYVAVFAVMAAATPPAVRAIQLQESALPILFIMTVMAVAMACVSVRFLRIALGLVVILLPVTLRYFRSHEGDVGRRLMIVGLTSLILLAVGRMYVFPPEQVKYDAFDFVVRGDCGEVDGSALRAVQAGRIMTSPRLGIELAHKQPPPRLSVSAIPFHRASGAMSDVFAVLMGRTAAENERILRNFDYLAFCRIPPHLPNEDKLPLLRDLQAGVSVPGLQPLSGDGPVMIFRVDHAKLK
jgi:hypothetical protein